jgi:hypothetical protein
MELENRIPGYVFVKPKIVSDFYSDPDLSLVLFTFVSEVRNKT